MLGWLRRAIFGPSREELRRRAEDERDLLIIDVRAAIQARERHQRLLAAEAAELRAGAKRALGQQNRALAQHFLQLRRLKLAQTKAVSDQIVQLSLCYDQMTGAASLRALSDQLRWVNAYMEGLGLGELGDEYAAEAALFREQSAALQRVGEQVEQLCDSQLGDDMEALQDEVAAEAGLLAPVPSQPLEAKSGAEGQRNASLRVSTQ